MYNPAVEKVVRSVRSLLREQALFIGIVAVVFSLGLPLASSINYLQNDDYIHVIQVQHLLEGNFVLDPYLASTFYTQGLLGGVWAKVFGLNQLPILTLVCVAITAGLVAKTSHEFYSTSKAKSALIAFIYITSPIILYLTFGFMTESYALLFLVASFYFSVRYFSNSKRQDFIYANIAFLLGYLVRQTFLVLPLIHSLGLFLNRRYKASAIQLLFSFLLIGFHFFVFPQTDQMRESLVGYGRFLTADRVVSLYVIYISYLGVFFFPLFFQLLFSTRYRVGKVFLLKAFITVGVLLFAWNHFVPDRITMLNIAKSGPNFITYPSPEFPYLGNVLQRTGYLAANLGGVKYHYPGFYDVFKTFELLGLSASFIFLVTIVFGFKLNFKRLLPLLYIIGSLGTLLIAPKLYDRYVVALIPAFLFYALSFDFKREKLFRPLVVVYALFMAFLSYQYLMDFHLVNKYVWNKSVELTQQGVPANRIKAEHSWQMLNPKSKEGWLYVFSYPETDRLKGSEPDYEVVDEFTPNYPLNFYLNPKVYLLKRVGGD